jgi:succinate dehydrogenase (ubiquinone) membrane anchor subunit
MDYLHKRKRPFLGPLMTWTVRLATTGVLVGVYQFNTNDIGASLYFVCFRHLTS